MSRRKSLISLVVILWLLFVFVLYYSGHKPAQSAQLTAIALALWRVLVAVLLAALAGGLGRLLLPGEQFHPLARLALQGGLGFGLLGLGTLAVGSLGMPGWLPWAALVVLGLLLWRSGWAWLREWRGLASLLQESAGFERGLASLLGVIFAATLTLALAPPLQFDSLTYHLALPDAYLREGRIAYLPWIVMSGMPQMAELLYAWAIALGGNQTAVVLGWTFGLLAVAGLLGMLRQAFDPRAAWVGAAALLAGFTPVLLLASGYVDWLVFLEALGALIWLSTWREGSPGTVPGRSDRRKLAWAGVFTGLAVGSKYTSIVLALAGLVVVAWHAWKRRERFFPMALIYGLSALAVAMPWFIKNVLTTGNPFYPFFFSGGAMTPVRLQVYQHLSPWGNWLDLAFLPIRATYLGFDSGDGYMFAPGALLLGLGALAWLAKKERGFSGLLSTAIILALAGLALWVAGNQYSGNLIQTRYYFSIFPAFAVLAAAGEQGLRSIKITFWSKRDGGEEERVVRLGNLAGALILIAISLTTLEISIETLKNGAPQAALGLKSEEAYLADALGWFQPAMKAVRDLPDGKTVQLIYEARSLYCAPRCMPDEILDRWKRAWLEWGPAAQDIRQSWVEQGVTHLLINRQGVKFLREAADPHHPPSDLLALEDFLTTLPLPIEFGAGYALYSLE